MINSPPSHIAISCSQTVRDILCEALNSYAQDVLPEKEPGQYGATRHQLLKVISTLKKTRLNTDHVMLIDQSYKGPCLAAIHYHYSRIRQTLNASVAEQKQVLLDLLQGIPACDNQLESALKRDNLL